MGRWAIVFCSLVVLTGLFVFGAPESTGSWLLRAFLFLGIAAAVVMFAARRRSAEPPPT